MLITCPECDTSYEIDRALIPLKGRDVRCASCNNVWLVSGNLSSINGMKNPNHKHDGPAATRFTTPKSVPTHSASTSRANAPRHQATGQPFFTKPSVSYSSGSNAALKGPQENFYEDSFDIEIEDVLFEEIAFDELEEINDVNDIADPETTRIYKRERPCGGSSAKIEILGPESGPQTSYAPIEPHFATIDDKPATPPDDPQHKAPSPFHAELDALHTALAEKGLIELQAQSSLSKNTPLAALEAYESAQMDEKAIATIEGDVSKEQLSRQFAETKIAAGFFARSSARFIKLFLRYTPEGLKKNYKPAPTLYTDVTPSLANEVTMEQPTVVSDYRHRLRVKAKNKITPLKLLGWSLWAGTIASCVFVMAEYNQQIMKTVPRSMFIYSALGFEVPQSPLILDQVNHRFALSTAGPVAEISGILKNQSADIISSPYISATGLSAGGKTLGVWEIAMPVQQIGPQVEIPFLARANVPKGVVSLKLTALVPAEKDILKSFNAPGVEDSTFFIQSTHGGGWANPQSPSEK